MKKFLKWGVIALLSAVVIVIAGLVVLNKTGYLEKQRALSQRANGKVLATMLLTQMKMMELESGSYPDKAAGPLHSRNWVVCHLRGTSLVSPVMTPRLRNFVRTA